MHNVLVKIHATLLCLKNVAIISPPILIKIIPTAASYYSLSFVVTSAVFTSSGHGAEHVPLLLPCH